nr:ARID DNA-binding domain-containing protein [Tanacetum cinerariifolium]
MDLTFKNNKCRPVYMFKDPTDCSFDENKMNMRQNKYMEDYFKLLKESTHYDEGKTEKKDVLTQKCHRSGEIRHHAYACLSIPTSVGNTPRNGDYVYVKESLGGYLSIYFAKEFGYIAEMFGPSHDYGEEIRKCYNKYLDVFKCYYSTTRVPQEEQGTVPKKTTSSVVKGKEITCFQSHCGDHEDQVTGPIG